MNTRFIRKAKLRDRAFDVFSKAVLIAVSVLACLWMVSGAHASQGSILGIHSAAQPDGSVAIDFSLSQKLNPENVAVEFERNFIQLSLKGVSAYPARTEQINQGTLEKVFTYQYQPDLARARVLLKAAASTIKNRAGWELTPAGVRITVKGMAEAAADAVKIKAAAASLSANLPITADTDEERIVQEILSESKTGGIPKASEDVALFAGEKKTAAAPTAARTATEEQAIFAPKPAESAKSQENAATRIFASLLLVIGIIGATAVGYRRFALGKGISFQRQAKLIEVIANQGLGPKRSIALVKVLDQFMVVGMSGDGMTLLANLGTDVKIDKFLDTIGGSGASFSDTLDGALAGVPDHGARTDTAGPPIAHKVQLDLGIRAAIKKRIEGFKPL